MYNYQAVTLRGFHHEMFHLTMNLTGLGTKVDGDPTVVARAIALDPSAPNSAKLAGDGDVIIGRLSSFENRKVEGIVVGAVEFRFSNTLPIADGATVEVGDTVVGAGDGKVKAAATNDPNVNFVAEIIGDMAVVCKF